MAENSNIEWTDHTFNPWMGCTKVSPACKNCYAEDMMDNRYGKVQWGPNGTRVLTSDANWKKPIKWDGIAAAERNLWKIISMSPCIPTFDICEIVKDSPESVDKWLEGMAKRGVIRANEGNLGGWIAEEWSNPRVFCASLADVLEDWKGDIVNSKGNRLCVNNSTGWIYESPDRKMSGGYRPMTMNDVRIRLFELPKLTPNIDWLFLTKRIENARQMIIDLAPNLWNSNNNVWLGTSVENQEQAEKRIPELLKCHDLAANLFLSCEPLLGPLDLRNICNGYGEKYDCLTNTVKVSLRGEPAHRFKASDRTSIDWVIAGGESGPNARPSHPDWFRGLRDQCKAAGVPFLFKQWGEYVGVEVEDDPDFSGGRAFDDPSDGRMAAVKRHPAKKAFQTGKWSPLVAGDQIKKGVMLDDDTFAVKVGKKKAGRTLDGKTHDGFPVTSE